MTEGSTRSPLPADVFARLGEGAVAYVREFEAAEFGRLYPGGPALPPGLRLWALIGATGTPIMVSDDRDVILSGALEQAIVPVSRH
jgi:hypothetical protein